MNGTLSLNIIFFFPPKSDYFFESGIKGQVLVWLIHRRIGVIETLPFCMKEGSVS